MSESNSRRRERVRIAAFLLVQVGVLGTAVGVCRAKLAESEARARLPALRQVPRQIGPLYDDPGVASDEQLRAVLYKLRPRLRGPKPTINHVDHALRFWGVEARFRDPQCLSGTEMRDILLRHRKFAEVWGKETPPLLAEDAKGLLFRTMQGLATSGHIDHTLGCLAEVGTPLDYPVETPNGGSTVRALLEASLRRFSLNQGEYEWSALAYALYCDSAAPWDSLERQEISFDRLAERIIREELPRGVCFGQHRLHALVMSLRIDEEQRILSPACRANVIRHLREVAALLSAGQDPQGYWNDAWAEGIPPAPEDLEEEGPYGTLARRLLATGHILEWLALAPEEVQPPRTVVRRGGQWLCHAVAAMSDEQIQRHYTVLTHVGRGLALWRGRFPSYYADVSNR
jgi:hypothetical protein